jgi:hypothetical protein
MICHDINWAFGQDQNKPKHDGLKVNLRHAMSQEK